MFKAHYLQKTWRALSMKCDVSLDELEKAAQAPKKTGGTSEARGTVSLAGQYHP